MRTQSQFHSSFDPRLLAKIALDGGFKEGKHYKTAEFEKLSKIGIGLDAGIVREMMAHSYGMDTIQQPLTQPSIPSLVQFLQNWLPGMVKILTAARKIDEILGVDTVGSWEDEQIVQPVLENTGTAVPYGDTTNVPLANYNVNFVYRTVVRFEEGMRVGTLEEARAARIRVNSGESKRESAALNLEIQRNAVGFYGYNGGANNTYGFLNDPQALAYLQVATGAVGFRWSQKTFLEICSDLRVAIVQLRTQSQDTIDPESTDITLAIATNAVDFLSTISDFGVSVRDWLKVTYPRIRVTSAPQLNAANAGSGVFIMFADRVNDTSTDNAKTWTQVVPSKFQVLGVQKLAKGYEEDYSNATAGALLKRPFAMVRYYGIS